MGFQKGCNSLFDSLYLNYFNFFVTLKTIDSPIYKKKKKCFLSEIPAVQVKNLNTWGKFHLKSVLHFYETQNMFTL